jgi:hypothetical protein
MALDHSCQVRRHPLSERGLDLYETPAVAVEALLRVEQLTHTIWEPAAGRGAIVKVLRDHGHAAIASDVYDYGFPLHFCQLPHRDGNASGLRRASDQPAIQHCRSVRSPWLELSPLVIMLLRLAFLESERRCEILEGRGLALVHVFRKRFPMMHRDQWTGKKANSGMAFGWFVWERGFVGPTTIDRISWERP